MKMMIKNVLEPMMSTKDMINNLKMKNIMKNNKRI